MMKSIPGCIIADDNLKSRDLPALLESQFSADNVGVVAGFA